MRNTSKKKVKKITTAEFDAMAERGEDLFDYIDFSKVVVVRRINIDLSKWMLQSLDREALKLNISRQAVVKTWIKDRLVIEGYALKESKGKAKVTRRANPARRNQGIVVAHTDNVRRFVPAKKHQPNYRVG